MDIIRENTTDEYHGRPIDNLNEKLCKCRGSPVAGSSRVLEDLLPCSE